MAHSLEFFLLDQTVDGQERQRPDKAENLDVQRNGGHQLLDGHLLLPITANEEKDREDAIKAMSDQSADRSQKPNAIVEWISLPDQMGSMNETSGNQYFKKSEINQNKLKFLSIN